MKKITVICLAFFLVSCFKPDINITREYISNSAWQELEQGEAKGPVVMRIIIDKDIASDVNNSDFNFEKILNNYSIDSTFYFDGISYSNDHPERIYFDRLQDDFLWTNNKTLNQVKAIGKLDFNTWYRFDGLHDYQTFYAYVDDEGMVHVFKTSTSGFGV